MFDGRCPLIYLVIFSFFFLFFFLFPRTTSFYPLISKCRNTFRNNHNILMDDVLSFLVSLNFPILFSFVVYP